LEHRVQAEKDGRQTVISVLGASCGLCASFPVAQHNLTLPREVNGLAENPRSFLRRVKAGGVFSFDEVQVKLRLALEVLRGR
jgi:hypothetical protein